MNNHKCLGGPKNGEMCAKPTHQNYFDVITMNTKTKITITERYQRMELQHEGNALIFWVIGGLTNNELNALAIPEFEAIVLEDGRIKEGGAK